MRSLLLALTALMIVSGCRTSTPPAPRPAASPGALTGSWVVEQIDGSAVVERTLVTIGFDTPARVSGRATCNLYSARLTLSGNTMRIDEAITTKMACPAALMDQERRFLAAIGAVTTYRRDGNRLLLLDKSGRVRLRLGAPAAGAGPGPG